MKSRVQALEGTLTQQLSNLPPELTAARDAQPWWVILAGMC
jgi:hypothetical protein